MKSQQLKKSFPQRRKKPVRNAVALCAFAPLREKTLPQLARLCTGSYDSPQMKFLRPLLAFAFLAVLIVAAWLWWTLPSRVDMADYAPADSLVYVEINDLGAVAEAIQQSEAWQAAAPITQTKSVAPNRIVASAMRAG